MANRTRSVSSYSTFLNAAPERVFPLLCPVREYEWIEWWRGEMVYSDSGVAEKDCVFTSTVFEAIGPETWTCSHYDPPSRIEYVRMSDRTVIRLELILEPAGPGTRLKGALVVTAVNEAGEEILKDFNESTARKHFTPGFLMLDHYLTTGTMLPQQQAMDMAAGMAG